MARSDRLLALIQALREYRRPVSGAALSEAMLTETVPRLNVLLEDVQRSSRGVERLLYEINDQPQSLIFGRNIAPPGPGEPGFSAPRSAK